MEDKKPRVTGSKVSQIANIFQSMVPHKETDSLGSSMTVRNKPTIKAGDGPSNRDVSPPSPVTVVRTESHLTRFNNARALFEKLGADQCSSSGPTASNLRIQSTQSPAIHSDISSSATPTHNRLSCSLSQERSFSDVIPVSVNVLSTVNGQQTAEKVKDGAAVCLKNGLSTSSQMNHDKTMQCSSGSHVSYESSGIPCVESSKPKEIVCVTGADTKESYERICDKEPLAKNEKLLQSLLPVYPDSKKSGKPDKPERKFNSRELIEKQKNWTSHFPKSRTARHNNETNKYNLKTGLSGNNVNLDSPIKSSEWSPDSLASTPSYSPGSTSFSSSSSSYPRLNFPESDFEYSKSLSKLPISPEDKHDKETSERIVDNSQCLQSSIYSRQEEKSKCVDGKRESPSTSSAPREYQEQEQMSVVRGGG